MQNRRGFVLILLIFLIIILSLVAASISMILFNVYRQAEGEGAYLSAMYLAEGAIAFGRYKLAENQNFYTDLEHKKQDDKDWLINKAVGLIIYLGDGYFKVVREKDKDTIYGIGYLKKSRSVIKYYITENRLEII